MPEFYTEKRFVFKTINDTADCLGLPRHMIRRAAKLGKVPGFYVGTRYYCNVPLLIEKLEKDAGEVLSQAPNIFLE